MYIHRCSLKPTNTSQSYHRIGFYFMIAIIGTSSRGRCWLLGSPLRIRWILLFHSHQCPPLWSCHVSCTVVHSLQGPSWGLRSLIQWCDHSCPRRTEGDRCTQSVHKLFMPPNNPFSSKPPQLKCKFLFLLFTWSKDALISSSFSAGISAHAIATAYLESRFRNVESEDQ